MSKRILENVSGCSTDGVAHSPGILGDGGESPTPQNKSLISSSFSSGGKALTSALPPIFSPILHLNVKRFWFEQLASGRKKFEFRERKPYWQKRLFYPDGKPKPYLLVNIKNGYGRKAPSLLFTFEYLTELDHVCHGKVYKIALGVNYG